MKTTKEKTRDALIKLIPEGTENNRETWFELKAKKECGEGREIGIMEVCNVAMITPLNEKSYDLMRTICADNERWTLTPELSYVNNTDDSTSKYSVEYLEQFIKLAKAMSTNKDSCSPVLSVANDYPMTVLLCANGYEYSLILAPRVDGD